MLTIAVQCDSPLIHAAGSVNVLDLIAVGLMTLLFQRDRTRSDPDSTSGAVIACDQLRIVASESPRGDASVLSVVLAS